MTDLLPNKNTKEKEREREATGGGGQRRRRRRRRRRGVPFVTKPQFNLTLISPWQLHRRSETTQKKNQEAVEEIFIPSLK